MRHAEIPVSAIDPNPHRDFGRNPVKPEQVSRLVESIGRTGFWDNVVVREHPAREGRYQLAYGHTRLAAYARSKRGTIVHRHAAMVYPDDHAHGRGENPQYLYTVRFDGSELWGDAAEPGTVVLLDLFEPYLESA